MFWFFRRRKPWFHETVTNKTGDKSWPATEGKIWGNQHQFSSFRAPREINPHLLPFQVLKAKWRSWGLLSHGAGAALSSSSSTSRLFTGIFSLPLVNSSSLQGFAFIFPQAEIVPADKTGELWNKCKAQNAPQGLNPSPTQVECGRAWQEKGEIFSFSLKITNYNNQESKIMILKYRNNRWIGK